MNKPNRKIITPSKLESDVGAKLSQLLSEIDFKVDFSDTYPGQSAPDFIAKKLIDAKKEYKIAIELKSSSNFIDAIKHGTKTLEKVKSQKQFDKLLLVLFTTLSGSYQSSPQYQQLIRKYPADIEIITYYDLEKWVSNLKDVLSKEEINEVQILIRE